MYLQSIACATPRNAYTQNDCWVILKNSGELGRLTERSVGLLEKVLKGDSGIHKRHFASDPVERLFSMSAEALNATFEKVAPYLAEEALTLALNRLEIDSKELDALFICTCTGYLCPGLTSYLAEKMEMRPNTYLQDIVGLGCGAAIPTLRSAEGFLSTHPKATVACIAVEICSAAFYLDNDPGVLISACLFGDGASATIWSGNPGKSLYSIDNFDTIHAPEHRELLRFRNRNGKLRNQLDRTIPEVAATYVLDLYQRANLPSSTKLALHVGGRDVLDALELKFPEQDLSLSRKVLRDYGNTSSPSVLFVLEELLKQTEKPKTIWLSSFGAGFAAHSCQLSNLSS